LSGSTRDLEAVWDVGPRARATGWVGGTLARVGVAGGWDSGASWAGLTLDMGGAWWSLHAAAGWPFASVDVEARVPWPFAEYGGLGGWVTGAASWDGPLQADARCGVEVYAGPKWLQVAGGLTWVVAPNTRRARVSDWRSLHLRPKLLRRHLVVAFDARGWSLSWRVEYSRDGVAGRWAAGYRSRDWAARLLGDVLGGSPRVGVELEWKWLTGTVLVGRGNVTGSVGLDLEW